MKKLNVIFYKYQIIFGVICGIVGIYINFFAHRNLKITLSIEGFTSFFFLSICIIEELVHISILFYTFNWKGIMVGFS